MVGFASPKPSSLLRVPMQPMEHLQRQAAGFQELLGLASLPQTGRQAQAASRQLGQAVLGGVTPPPLLSQLVQEWLAAGWPPARARFVDVTTGLRLRYLEWGPSGSSDVVLLLHDVGEAADIWASLGPRLADRGYRVLALDLRGHGESGRSLDGRYSAEALAEDVKAFIVAKDLYVAPLAVVGCGMGAAAGLALAQAAPFLVGALVAAEFTLPVAVVQAAEAAASSSSTSNTSVSSSTSSSSTTTTTTSASSSRSTSGSSSDSDCAAEGGPAGGSAGACSAPGGPIAAGGGGQAAHPATKLPTPGQQPPVQVSSKDLLPWWGFRAGQACQFASVEHCAAFLAHPLCNVAPALLLPLGQAASAAAAAAAAAATACAGTGGGGGGAAEGKDVCAAATDAAMAAAAALKELFGQLQRPLRGAVASACSLLRLPAGLIGGSSGGGSGGYWEEDDWEGVGGGLSPRMDPAFLFSFDAAALLRGLPNLRCHLLLLRGSRGSWADPTDAAAIAAVAAAGGAASATAAPELPGAGHWLAADHPDQLLKQIVSFLEGPAIRCFDRRALPSAAASASCGAPAGCAAASQGVGCRRPELLDLKPLPQYTSMEEAQKALGPRPIPTAAVVEAELRRLRVEEGRAASDASSDGGGAEESSRHQTALARDPPTYFGFVG